MSQERVPREGQQQLNPTHLIRWTGLAAILGGLGILQGPMFHPDETPEGFASPAWVASHFALYVGYVLIQLGLVGILVRQLQAAGRLGALGFAIAFFGAGFTLMEGRDHIFSLPIRNRSAPLWGRKQRRRRAPPNAPCRTSCEASIAEAGRGWGAGPPAVTRTVIGKSVHPRPRAGVAL